MQPATTGLRGPHYRRGPQSQDEREEHFIDLAADLVASRGAGALTLGELAKNSSYTRSTVYNHFDNREDLITALCVRALRIQLPMYELAATFPGPSRHRLLAVHVAYHRYAKRHPHLFGLLLIANRHDILARSSAARIDQRNALDRQIVAVVSQPVHTAIDTHEIPSPNRSATEIAFSTTAIGVGHNALAAMAPESRWSTINPDSERALVATLSSFFNGIDWTPVVPPDQLPLLHRRIGEHLDTG